MIIILTKKKKTKDGKKDHNKFNRDQDKVKNLIDKIYKNKMIILKRTMTIIGK